MRSNKQVKQSIICDRDMCCDTISTWKHYVMTMTCHLSQLTCSHSAVRCYLKRCTCRHGKCSSKTMVDSKCALYKQGRSVICNPAVVFCRLHHSVCAVARGVELGQLYTKVPFMYIQLQLENRVSHTSKAINAKTWWAACASNIYACMRQLMCTAVSQLRSARATPSLCTFNVPCMSNFLI